MKKIQIHFIQTFSIQLFLTSSSFSQVTFFIEHPIVSNYNAWSVVAIDSDA